MLAEREGGDGRRSDDPRPLALERKGLSQSGTETEQFLFVIAQRSFNRWIPC